MLSTDEHQLNYQNFQVRRQVFPGNGSAEGGLGLKQHHFKKNPTGSKRRVFIQNKKSSQRNIQYYNIHHIDFKSTLEIYFPRLSRKTKISDCNFFLPIMP